MTFNPRLFNFYHSDEKPNFPPYDLIVYEDGKYILRLAVAGYAPDDIEITVKDNDLEISSHAIPREGFEFKGFDTFGNKVYNPAKDSKARYEIEGIKKSSWRKRFRLSEHMKVTGAKHVNGILDIALTQEVPEEQKPQVIKIET